MAEPLPNAQELVLAPNEETPEVAKAHGEVLVALRAQDLSRAQRLTADLIDMLDLRPARAPCAKTLRLIDFVVLLS